MRSSTPNKYGISVQHSELLHSQGSLNSVAHQRALYNFLAIISAISENIAKQLP